MKIQGQFFINILGLNYSRETFACCEAWHMMTSMNYFSHFHGPKRKYESKRGSFSVTLWKISPCMFCIKYKIKRDVCVLLNLFYKFIKQIVFHFVMTHE